MELLAPAGNFEKLKYALAYGADAVYAGQPQFSLRARENSFESHEEIGAAIEYTHKLGKLFYLASNIIPHNNKIRAFEKSLHDIIALKPDALIMSDAGMIHYVRKNFPQQVIHLSVQANCTNWSTARFWHEMGVKRIIMSRELNLREIEEIHVNCPEVEIEVFVHGAICMAHSGRCLLSNYMNHRASNQGACSNACRFEYQLYAHNKSQSEDYIPLKGDFYLKEKLAPGAELMLIDEDQYGTYIMNSKDMCAIEYLDKIQNAGVISAKIEGRTKSLYYLAQSVRSYRGALDDLAQGLPFNPVHLENIQKLDSRGTIPGFFIPLRELPQNYSTSIVPSETAFIAGIIRRYEAQARRVYLSVKGSIHEGDYLELASPRGQKIIQVSGLRNPKDVKVDKVSSGIENASFELSADPGEFSMLIGIRGGYSGEAGQ